jgi:two-component system LytT family sensor kinase
MPGLNNTPYAAPPEPAAALRLDGRFWLLNAACWLGICLFFYSRAFLLALQSRTTPFLPVVDGLETLGTFGQWALFTPVIVWLSRRVPLMRGRRLRALLIHVVVSAVVALAAVGVKTLVASFVWTDEPQRFERHFIIFFHWMVMFYWLILSMAQVLEYHRRWQGNQLRSSKLETELARAELKALKMQIEPHFLYNTLHTISEMVHAEPAAAERMIARLGQLLRHTTESGSQEVPLEREIEFLRAYLEIEQARFHDRLAVSIDVPDVLLACSVPSLVLQPLVENAIRHGTSRLAGAGTVRIDAARRGDTLVLRVADNGPGLRPSSPGRGTGVGLRNIRSRLGHLYGDAASLQLNAAEGGGLEAVVSLPFHPAPAQLATSTTGGVDESTD